jgi:hypothetical protein
MRFMLLICNNDSFRPPPTLEPEVIAWVEEAKRRGARISGDPSPKPRPCVSAATSVHLLTDRSSKQRRE